MTNAEKFEEVFGVKPDTDALVLDCPSNNMYMIEMCPYYDLYTRQCHCDEWWYQTYTCNRQGKEALGND